MSIKLRTTGRMAAAMAFGFAMLAVGCIKSDHHAISVSGHLFRVEASGGELELRVTSNTDWSASGYPSWITLSPASGKGSVNIAISVAPDDDPASTGRAGTVTFKTGGSNPEVVTVVIEQGKQASASGINPTDYTINASGGSVFFVVTSTGKWDMTGDYDWITVGIDDAATTESAGDVMVTLKVDKYELHNSDRVAHFVITGDGNDGPVAETFTLTQTGLDDPSLILGQNEINFPAVVAAETLPRLVPVITNVRVSPPVVDAGPWWCTTAIRQTGGIWYVEITPRNNTGFDGRAGVVTVFIPDVDDAGNMVMEQIKVTQDGAEAPYFEVLSQVANIPARSVTRTVGYLSNSPVEVHDWPEWVTSATTGGAGTVTFTSEANPNAYPRSGTISLVATAGGIRIVRAITVIQQGADELAVTLAPTLVDLPALEPEPADQRFTVYAHTSATGAGAPTIMQVDGNWITAGVPAPVTVPSGTAYTIEFTYTANRQHAARTGTIQMFWTADGQFRTSTLNVTQDGVGDPSVVVIPTFATIDNEAGATVDVALLNAGSVELSTVVSPDTWLEVASDLTATKDRITLKATAANPGAVSREATLFIIAEQGGVKQILEVDVCQPGTGGAAISLPKDVYRIDKAAATFDIPALALNGSTVEIVGYTPEIMFASAPTLGGSPTGSVHVDITQNTVSTPRTGEVVLLATNGTDHRFYPIEIVQEGLSAINSSLVSSILTAPWEQGVVEETLMVVNLPAGTASADVTFSSPASWITGSVAEVTGSVATIALTVAANPKTTARQTPAVVTVARGGETKDIPATIVQQGAPAPMIYPATHSVIFPAEANGAAAATLVDIIGFDAAEYDFTYHQTGTWFTVVPPSSPMKIYPVSSLAGESARTGKVDVTVTSKADAGFSTQFTINVTQQSPAGANIGYAPATHTVGTAGTSPGFGVVTVFANPDGLTLEVTSGLDPNFVSAATWTTAGRELSLTVRPNTGGDARTAVVNVVTRQGNNVVGAYPITVIQSGVSSPAPTLVAQFISANSVVYGSSTGNEALMYLEQGATLTGAGVFSSPVPSWLKGVSFETTGENAPKITYDIDATASDYPSASGSTASAQIVAAIEIDGNTYSLYYTVTAVAQSLPEIGALLAAYSGTIAAQTTAANIAFTDDKGTGTPPAVVRPVTLGSIQYVGSSAGWLDNASFTLSGTSPARSVNITGIEANTTTLDRSAVITLRLTQPAHQDQYINYILTQKGIPLINAVWKSSYIAGDTDTQLVIRPTSNPNGGTIPPGTTIDLTFPTWVKSVSVSGDAMTLTMDANLTDVPKTGDIVIKLQRAGYADQQTSIVIIQMPKTTNVLITPSSPTLAWTPDSKGNITYVDNNVGGGPATVSVVSYDTSLSATTGNVATPGTIPVTTLVRNVTGANRTGNVVLKVVSNDGQSIEWYNVDVFQRSATTADLYSRFSFRGSYGITPETFQTTADGNVSFTVTIGTVGGYAYDSYVEVHPDSLVNDYVASGFTEISDGPDMFWNFGETSLGRDMSPSWTGSSVKLFRRGRSNTSAGTSYYSVTATVGSVSATFRFAITRN